MSRALAAGFALLRREPLLLWVLFIAYVGPAILGLVPLDRALAPLLDLQPSARSLVDGAMDDALVGELLRGAPLLPGVAIGGALVALVLAVPGAWLAATFIAARAQGSPLSARVIAGRGIGAALITLPLRSLPLGAAALIVIAGRETRTLAAVGPFLVAGMLVYAIGSATITVIGDLTRGLALADPERTLPGTLGAALRTARREPALLIALIAGELALALICLGVLTLTRPLGVYQGATLALALGALLLRAAGSVVLIAAASTGAASRSA